MKYFYVKNLQESLVIECTDISQRPCNRPVLNSKAEFRAWSSKPDTDHCFYSICEGTNASTRVNEDNPVNRLHGLVADYDVPPEDWDKIDELIKTRAVDCPVPTWRSRTFSGGVRLVWEFEDPLPISPDIAQNFLKRLSDSLRASMLLAGYDRTSVNIGRFFEIGEDWTKIGQALSAVHVQTILFKVLNDSPITSSETNIPLEDIEAQIHKQFPNRWKGAFEVGARGPLFWVDDGVDRQGCQVREEGIVCYSDRAEKGFMSWRDLFGKQFVEKYELQKMSKLYGHYWFNGKNFYKLLNGTPVTVPKELLLLELRQANFSLKRKKGQSLSEVDQAILTISNEYRVEEVAPVVFSKERTVSFNGRHILNSNRAHAIQSAQDGDPKMWPWIHSFFHQFFADDVAGNSTLPYFLAWYKRLYEAVLNHRLDQGHLLILLGPTGFGKTLLTNKIVGSSVGGYSDASDYLSGKTSFNKDLCGSAAWVIDDQTAAATYSDQRKFVELTKRCVANPRLEFHAKYADAVPLPWAGRVMMSLNLDANSLAALPTLDSSNRDKIMALRASGKSNVKFGSNQRVEQIISQEMPHMLRWLLDWSMPSSIEATNRFGVVNYIDPFIEAAAYDNSSRSAIAEMVEFFAKKVRIAAPDMPVWRGTLTEFQVVLHECNGGRTVGNSNNVEFIRRGMTVLEENCRHNDNLRPVRSCGSGGGKMWEINLAQDYDIENGAAFPDLFASE